MWLYHPCGCNRSIFCYNRVFKSQINVTYADGVYTNSSGTLHWREYVGYCDSTYLNRTPTTLISRLSQTRATHFNQRQREWMAHSNYWAIQSVFSVLVRKWHWDRTVMMACYFEQLMGHDNDIIDLSWHRDNVIPHCFESKWATFFTTILVPPWSECVGLILVVILCIGVQRTKNKHTPFLLSENP